MQSSKTEDILNNKLFGFNTMMSEQPENMTDVRFGTEDDGVYRTGAGEDVQVVHTTRKRRWGLYLLLVALFVIVILVVVRTAKRIGREPVPSNPNTDAAGTPDTTPRPPTTSTTTPTSTSDGTTTTTPAPTNPTTPFQNASFECTGSFRLRHDEKLHTGEVLCSDNGEFVFGINSTGSLIKNDIVDGTGKHDTFYTGGPGDYFELHSKGRITVYNSSHDVQWEREPKIDMNIVSDCGSDIKCPYMHLHDNGVLNVVWDKGQDGQEHIKEVYDLTEASA